MRLDELFSMAQELGATRHGIVTAAQLRLSGADPDTVKAACRHHWQTPVRGVYAQHRRPLSEPELAHVAVAHAGPGAVVTGLIAARAMRLRWVPDLAGAMVLVAPHLRRRGAEGLVLVRGSAALSSMVTTPWGGVQLAPPAQVVVDTCRQLLAINAGQRRVTTPRTWYDAARLREIRGIVLGAVADGRCSADELLAVVDAGAVRESALIRRACRDALRGAASPPEAELVDDLMTYGVPFFCNVELWDGGQLVAVLDVYLVGTGVGGELDSKEVHAREDLLDLTLARHGRVERYGAKLCHITPTRYRSSPATFHEELFTAVRARQAQGLADPRELRLVPRGPLLGGPRRADPPYRVSVALPGAEDAAA